MSTNTRILATLVLIYAPLARKVLLIMQNEELMPHRQNAIYVSEQRNLLATAIVNLVGAFLIKNQKDQHLVINHMEKLLARGLEPLLSQLHAIHVHMDVTHAQMTKLNAIGRVIKAYRLVLMILYRRMKTIITTQLTSSATNS